MLKKIVIIGPESTGKSTLCEKLAAHFNGQWAKEYAREYLLAHGTNYSFENLLNIAKGQLTLEDEAIARASNNAQAPPLFIDTDMYVMKIWSEYVFQKCDNWILNRIVERKYDLYLLCNTDLPWVKDELREYPDQIQREKLYRYYKDAMVNQNTPWAEISGNYDDRLQKAIEAIGKLQ